MQYVQNNNYFYKVKHKINVIMIELKGMHFDHDFYVVVGK